MALRKSIRCTLSFAFLAVSAFGQDAVVYNSSGNAASDADPVATAGPLGDSFTNPSVSTLVDVKITLANTDPPGGRATGQFKHATVARVRPHLPPSTGSITVALWSSTTGGTPAPLSQIAVLGTLNDTSLTDVPTAYDFPVSGGITLAAGTRYWIIVSTANTSIAYWAYGADAGIGVTTEYWSDHDGSHPNTGEPYLMEVTVLPSGSATPVPPSLMLVLLGLGGIAFYVGMRRFASRVSTMGRL
jgi:hypothetical protein